MNESEIRKKVLSCLREIAPDVDRIDLLPSADLREELDLDSMDFLRFVQALHRELGVSVSETEYRLISTLDRCVEFLERSLEAEK